MNTPKIEVKRTWDSESVRIICVKHELYTKGNTKEYTTMLNRVEEIEPDTNGLYEIAKDIKEHSEDQTVSNIMFILEKDAVHTFFEIEGEED